MRWGILGAATIAGNQFIPAVRAAGGGEVVALASRDAERGDAFARKHGIPQVHRGYTDLLASREVDAVYIALPNSLHATWTVAAARAGKHVFCEKPLAGNASAAREAAAACDAAAVVAMEAFVFRCHPQTLRLQAWLREGVIGTVRTAHAAFHFLLPPERRPDNIRMRADLAGGALLDVGCYPVSWIRLAFGMEPAAATARAVWDRASGVDTQLVGLLHFDAGRAATLSCGFDARSGVEARIVGTAGELIVSQPYHPRGPGATITLRRSGHPDETHTDATDEPSFTAAVRHFQSRVRNGVPALVGVHDGVRNMEALDALRRSALDDGSTVPVRPV